MAGRRGADEASANHEAALTHTGVLATMAVEGAVNGAAFVAHLDQQRVPRLRPGQTVVPDNPHAHHVPAVRERIAAGCRVAGCPLGGMPAYSPDLNPIEGAFSEAKTRVRRAEARAHGASVAAFGAAPDTVTDAHGWVTHSGHRLRPANLPENRSHCMALHERTCVLRLTGFMIVTTRLCPAGAKSGGHWGNSRRYRAPRVCEIRRFL